MGNDFYERINGMIKDMKAAGKYKEYQHIKTPMSGKTVIENQDEVTVMCSNNYLGLCDKPEIINAGIEALGRYGAGAASVRFICGTFDIHRDLEKKTADFLDMEAALSYTSCWNANTAVIPALVGEGDCIISDELNHASIIDGCRLASKKVQRYVYRHSDMKDLERVLKETQSFGTRLLITDGVFSMEGDLAKLPDIRRLSDEYSAVMMVDESHATGVIGNTGRGTPEFFGLKGKIDIITGTYGKALGGAGGGFVAGRKEVIDLCIQTSRPSLFSNSLPPVVAAMALRAVEYLDENPEIVESLHKKTAYLRKELKKEGLEPLEGESAIIPIIVGDTARAIGMARAILEKKVFVTGFGFPVVPEGTARIRLQVSDALSYDDLDHAVSVIAEVFEKY
ncbi:MAG: glycine C-acetyltransferase [Clostridia bacterium]|nr:glycine C-acetyltransferase [Clostridia bacterium]